jgi:hypothetical protein
MDMQAAASPFPCDWWGYSFEDLGLDIVRPSKGGTYGRHDYSWMPPVPFALTGGLEWLEAAPVHDHHVGHWLEEHAPGKNARSAVAVEEAARRMNLSLPPAFVKFVSTPGLHERLRSSTDCFLDVGEAPVPSPKGGGHLVRFLCDSQGCVFWYLYLTADGSDHAVVAALDFFGTEAEREAAANWVRDEPDAEEIVFCGQSFEEFLCRFWLETEIWFAAGRKEPLPPGGEEYLLRYLERQGNAVASGRTSAAGIRPPTSSRGRTSSIGSIAFTPSRFALCNRDWAQMNAARSRPCRRCGRPAADLIHVLVLSPEEDWDEGTGRVGFLTVCVPCRRQVDFLDDEALSEAQAHRWREQRRLL